MKPRLIRNEQGQAIIYTALLLVLLLVFIGLAVDGGLLFELKRRVQTAADTAAVAAVVAKRNGGDFAAVTAAAIEDAGLNGFQDAIKNVTVTVNSPPASGPYMGTGGFVEVVISKISPTYFMRLLSLMSPGDYSTATVAARAVAGLEGPVCIYALNPTIGGGLAINGTPSLNAPDCGVYVASNASDAMQLEGQASINVESISIVGDYTCTGTSCGNIHPDPITGVPVRPDPFADLPVPTPSGPCLPSPQTGSGPATLYPGRYCNGITVQGIPSATFAPGVYYVVNGFRITSSPTVTGSGVTFYIASGQLKIDGSPTLTLTAPTSGPYEGILFFQNRANTTDVYLTGGSGMQLNGVSYTPGARLFYSGGSCTGQPPMTILVADTIQFVGGSCMARPPAENGLGKQVVLAE